MDEAQERAGRWKADACRLAAAMRGHDMIELANALIAHDRLVNSDGAET